MVFVRIAARNLMQSTRRTGLLGLGIGLVTMLLVLLTALSTGISDNLIHAATTMSSGHVTIGGFYKVNTGNAAPLVTHSDEILEIVKETTPELDYYVKRGRGWAKIISTTGSIQAGIAGLDVETEGRFFDILQLAPQKDYLDGGGDEIKGDPKRLAEPHTILLFANQAKKLGVDVGDMLTIQVETAGGRTNTSDVTVVAVAKDVGLLSMFAVYTPQSELLQLYQLKPDTTGAIWLYLKDIDDAPAVMARLRETLAAHGYQVLEHQAQPFYMKFETVSGEDWTGQKLDVTTWDDEVSFLTWVLTAFDTITWFLTVILVVIIAVGIMNTMWNAVRERTREVGTMRAIGMHRRQVLALFLIEALLLGLFATTAGAATGAIVAFVVDHLHLVIPIEAMQAILMSDELHLRATPSSLGIAIVFLTGFTALSALWPSIRAASLRPVTALGHVE